MRFQDFTKYLESLENTSGRIEMYRLLGELFQKADVEETRQIAYLCEGRLLPAFAGVETGMGERTIAAAIVSATGRSESEIALASQQLGDPGLVIESLLPKGRRSRLPVSDVYEALLSIARTDGKIALIDTNKHTIIKSAHPSPLSARNGFFGSRPFSAINRALRQAGKAEIEWQLPDI